jgi:hypothetical protein
MHRNHRFALTLSTSLVFAASPSTSSVAPDLDPRIVDDIRKADSALIDQAAREFERTLREQHQKDSVLLSSHLPEEIRVKAEEAARLFGIQKREFDSLRLADPERLDAYKSTVEMWRRTWEANRDAQIAKIADPDLRASIQDRIAQITRNHALVFAQLRERRRILQNRIDERKTCRPGGAIP